MFADGGINGPLNASKALSALLFLNGANPQANIDRLIGQDTGAPVVSWIRIGANGGALWYIAISGGLRFTVINHITFAGAAVPLVSGYYLTAPIQPGGTVNNAIEADANQILADMNANHLSGPLADTIIGHSMGGATAISLSAKLVALYGLTPGCVTFGAPRPAGTTICRQAATGSIRRYMGNADAVPYIPVPVSSLPSLLADYDPVALVTSGLFVHPAGGLVLQPDGSTPRAAELPSISPFPQVLSVAAWLFLQVTQTNTGHDLGSYAQLVTLWLNNTPNPAVVNPRPAPIEVADKMARGEVNAIQRAANAAIFRQVAVQDAAPVVMPSLYVFSAVKINAIWYVYLGDQLVCVGPTKKKALGIKDIGNDLLRRLGKQAVVDVANLVQQFQEYLDAATTPDSGISPQINSQFPPVQ